MTIIPGCPVCDGIPADHSAEACLARVVEQRDEATRDWRSKMRRPGDCWRIL